MADIPAASEVAARSYRAGFAGILDAGTLAARTADFFAGRFAASLPGLSVAARDGAVLGFSLVTDGHIDMLFVDPDVHGMGIGSALLDVAERAGAVSLECFAANAAARRLYERHGWRLARAYARPFAGGDHEFVRYEKGCY